MYIIMYLGSYSKTLKEINFFGRNSDLFLTRESKPYDVLREKQVPNE